MPPDLNSLPPSRSMSSSPMQQRAMPLPPRRDTPSPRPSSTSLAAAASMNAADLSRRESLSNSRGSPGLGRAGERRRSIVAMNLNLNDPTLPSPGELSSSDHRTSFGHSYTSASPPSIGGTRTISSGDPHHHHRTPSLGEIHQELEQEQEAQVNRMLQMIRDQQLRLDQARNHSDPVSRQSSQTTAGGASATAAILDDLTPVSERSFSLSSTTPTHSQSQTSHTRPSIRSSSRSPALRAQDSFQSAFDYPPSPSLPHSLLETATIRRNSNSLRDESAYYQAETASLTRENQMLRLRIRELERQVGETTTGSAEIRHGSLINVPSIHSPLVDGQDKRP